MSEQIKAIEKKYGEHTFRMSITHLLGAGHSNFENVDVEKACKDLIENTPANYIMTGELRAEIMRCSVELSKIPLWDILRYIQTDIKIDGATVHPGLFITFRRNATCEHITAGVVPAETDLSVIEEIEEEIEKMMDAYEEKHGSYYGFSYKDAIENAFKEHGIRIRSIDYGKTVYL